MERQQRFRKALALVSAAILVAALVLYRTGALGPLYMSGSKSTFVFVGSTITPPPTPAEQQPVPEPPRKSE
jgi:hypothetical protein